MKWTAELDATLLTALDSGHTLVEAAELVRAAAEVARAPHPTTCLRRARLVRARRSKIPTRVRRSFAGAGAPSVVVLSIDVDSGSIRTEVDRLLVATIPGWSWSIDESADARRDAVASARSRAPGLVLAPSFPESEPFARVIYPDARSLRALVVIRYERVDGYASRA